MYTITIDNQHNQYYMNSWDKITIIIIITIKKKV